MGWTMCRNKVIRNGLEQLKEINRNASLESPLEFVNIFVIIRVIILKMCW